MDKNVHKGAQVHKTFLIPFNVFKPFYGMHLIKLNWEFEALYLR